MWIAFFSLFFFSFLSFFFWGGGGKNNVFLLWGWGVGSLSSDDVLQRSRE